MFEKMRKDQCLVSKLYSKERDGLWEEPDGFPNRKPRQKHDRKYLEWQLYDRLKTLGITDPTLPIYRVLEVTNDLYIVQFRVKKNSYKCIALLELGYTEAD